MVPALTMQLLRKALPVCGSARTSRQESSVGSKLTNGMIAPSSKVWVSVLTEFTPAQRKGIRVKTDALISST